MIMVLCIWYLVLGIGCWVIGSFFPPCHSAVGDDVYIKPNYFNKMHLPVAVWVPVFIL